MTTREIETADGVHWTLAEAMVGSDAEREADTVPVVATPTGGEQTVRLDLAAGWSDEDDAALTRSLEAAREA